jgi:pyruvate dehydrogenase E1 component alpha subunit
MDLMLDGLGSLVDPLQFNGVLDVSNEEKEALFGYLKMMLIIRAAEEKIGEGVVAGKIKCPCHLGIGQEAIAMGVSAGLRASDRVFGAHRSHSHYLALGGSVEGLFAEVFGKRSGCSKGMGGSMHLYDGANGFMGSVPIVAATIPLSVGAALAAKMDGRGDVAVGYFGDGAAEEGVLHESLNLASNLNLPVLFVCENNLFASHLHIGLRQPSDSIARFARAHHINSEVVDGNDVLAVAAAAKKMIDRARKGMGPSFLEAVTYRWRGHVGPSEDTDVGIKRNQDLGKWKGRDPVRRLAKGMEQNGMLSPEEFSELTEEIGAIIDEAWLKAEEANFPDQTALLDLVYSRKDEER